MKPEAAAALALIASLALAACGGPTENEGVDRETYVRLYVDLIRASAAAPDSAAAARQRAEVMREHAVTPEQVDAFMRRHADDPAYLASVWLEIEERLRGDTLPEP